MPRDDGSLRRGEAEQIANEGEPQEQHTEEHLTDASDPTSVVTHTWFGDLEHSVAVFFRGGVRQEHHLTAEPASVVGPIALDAPQAADDGDLASLTPPPNPTLADGPGGDVG